MNPEVPMKPQGRPLRLQEDAVLSAQKMVMDQGIQPGCVREAQRLQDVRGTEILVYTAQGHFDWREGSERGKRSVATGDESSKDFQ